jgi:hypothetical protein
VPGGSSEPLDTIALIGLGSDGGILMRKMKVVDWIHVVAGIFILGSLGLGIWVHPYWFIFTAFVGLNLFQFGLTGFCPMGLILSKLGVGG